MALGPYEVAARLGGGVVTGHTEPPAPVTGQGAAIRTRSSERYGTKPDDKADETEAAARTAPVGRKRRPS